MKHNFKGRNAYRLKDTSTRKESVFAKSFREYNRENPDFLRNLLGEEPTEEQIEILCTLIQWMGTKQGFAFAEETLKKCTGLIKI